MTNNDNVKPSNQSIDDEFKRLIKWIDDPKRLRANTVFEEGYARQAACRFENLFARIKTLNTAEN